MGLEPYEITDENNPIGEHRGITPTCNLLITLNYKIVNNGGTNRVVPNYERCPIIGKSLIIFGQHRI